MQLVFYGRDAQPAVAPTPALLSIDRKGLFCFNGAAVRSLQLTADAALVLAHDLDTNTWYCVPGQVPGKTAFVLKPRPSKGAKALTFHSLAQGRAYWQAHGLNGQTSVRALVSATPVKHKGLRLYPLTPQHPTQGQAQAAPAAPLAESAPAAAPVVADTLPVAPDTSDNSASEVDPPAAVEVAPDKTPFKPWSIDDISFLRKNYGTCAVATLAKHLSRTESAVTQKAIGLKLAKKKATTRPASAQAQAPTAATVVETPAPAVATPAGPQLVYTPAPATGEAAASEPQRKTFGLHARAEELTATWSERELSQAKPNELAELLNLLRHVPASKRGVEMTLVLERAEREHDYRQTAAGKGDGRG